MAARRPAILLPLLALGCAADRGEEVTALMQQALFSTQASLVVAGAAPAAPAGSTPRHGPIVAARAIPPASSPGPRQRGTAPPAAASALLGSGADQMRRMLGDPALRRAEGEAEIRLYEAAPCRLDVILFPTAGGTLAVAHAAARAHGAAEGVTEAACLSAIATIPATAPWGGPGRRA